MAWRVRPKVVVSVAACVAVCILVWALSEQYFANDKFFNQFEYSCNLQESREFIESLCMNFSRREVTGSLCEPLCVRQQIQLKKCLGHGVKLHVLLAEWRQKLVVLKSSKPLANKDTRWFVDGLIPPNTQREKFSFTMEEFVYHMNRSISMQHGRKARADLSSKVTAAIGQECDVGGDGHFSYRELVLCWQMAINDEYVIYSLLRGNHALVDLYGVCGNMYALQYVPSSPLLGYSLSFLDGRSWSFRCRLALSMLDLVEVLEDTVYGVLHLCDFQEPNFGVVKSPNGTLVAKAIDADAAMFESSVLQQLELESGNKKECTQDEDCSIFHCESSCDRDTGTCSGKLLSTNLVNVCRRFLRSRGFLYPSFLANPPRRYKATIEELLDKCSQLGHPHDEKKLLNELRHVLTLTLNDT